MCSEHNHRLIEEFTKELSPCLPAGHSRTSPVSGTAPYSQALSAGPSLDSKASRYIVGAARKETSSTISPSNGTPLKIRAAFSDCGSRHAVTSASVARSTRPRPAQDSSCSIVGSIGG